MSRIATGRRGEIMGESMCDKAGRALLAKQLRALICGNEWALAVINDAAKVLECETLWKQPLVWPELPKE